MKIYTITCHDVYNYGASLQAYALQAFCESLGNQYEIIDYKPTYMTHKYAFTYLPKDNPKYNLYKKIGPFGFLLALFLRRDQLHCIPRKLAFDKFTSAFLHCTDKVYESNQELIDALPDGDLYITGSDQVWNTDMQNGRDDAYYLAFAPSDKKKISYAASFGLASIPDIHSTSIKMHLKRLDWISIREITGVRIANSLGFAATQVMDPVFLLSQNQWLSLCTKKHKEKYLLLYYLGERSSQFEDLVKKIAHERKLLIYSINDSKKVQFADKNINNAGPIEFLEYLSQAEYVLSTSFHATAFSLIFERQFGVCPIKGQNNQTRMRDVLTLFHLDDHFLEYGKKLPTDIEYNQITPLIHERLEESRNMLMKHLL